MDDKCNLNGHIHVCGLENMSLWHNVQGNRDLSKGCWVSRSRFPFAFVVKSLKFQH